ncbi:hypothetical protein Lalb_Chr02g0151821 [Lupinus albus]|uniref:Uncharacterized protein n=1 Tax=Lupinus albus TaxID=3870 RepID=A0A6A4QY20_LUPAL|nr:hypothetical protein Lalb_Chr02g0151821 [Lupinus albus]
MKDFLLLHLYGCTLMFLFVSRIFFSDLLYSTLLWTLNCCSLFDFENEHVSYACMFMMLCTFSICFIFHYLKGNHFFVTLSIYS